MAVIGSVIAMLARAKVTITPPGCCVPALALADAGLVVLVIGAAAGIGCILWRERRPA
jgi:hypothetical protein